ncbi:MAG TPA: hypothetical protein ENI23_11840 [bacterium]|nr:hypothetical protein [bacterium]
MTALLEIIEKLQETHKTITNLEAYMAKHPKDETLIITTESLYSRQRDLEKAFAEISDKEHLDVCSYRLIAEDRDRFSISALSSTLHEFQSMVTDVYEAYRTGPKIKAVRSPKIVQESSFDFAYAYPGSLGFVLTVPRERLLGEIFLTTIEKAIDSIFKVVKAKNNEEIHRLAEQIGIASIRSIHKWANSHSQYGVSADIQWKRKQRIRNKLFVETTELEHLGKMIETTSKEKHKEMDIPHAKLVGLDIDLKTFHIKRPDAKDIKGKISDSFNFGKSYTITCYYSVKLIRKTKIHYAYEKEDEVWELLSLEKK